MKALKHTTLDCQTFEAYVQGRVTVTLLEDLCYKVPHAGYGGASKSSYTSPESGKTIFVLERNGWYAGDAYSNDVWLFGHDFTAEEVFAFIADFDLEHAT